MSRSFYITTPIYYVNGEPHIGHTYTTVLADTLTRYHQLCGERGFLLTGSDEHGEKIYEVAQERGVPVRELADHYSEMFQQTWQDLGIVFVNDAGTTERPDLLAELTARLARLRSGFDQRFWTGVSYRSPDHPGPPDDRANALVDVPQRITPTRGQTPLGRQVAEEPRSGPEDAGAGNGRFQSRAYYS